MDVTGSPRILITRLSHIGDCILTLPLLAAVRRQFPDAMIAWAVESPTQKLLALHPAINEIVMIPNSWIGKPKNWMRLRRKLRSYHFDIAIDPQGITKSAMLGWLSGAPTRIGGRGRWGRELSPYLNNLLVEPEASHVVDRSLEILSAIGIQQTQASTSDLALPICPASNAMIESELATLNVNERFVVINPGGSWASKRWEMDRFGAVANYLKQTCDLTSVVVWAGEEERQMAQDIHRVAPDATVIAPPTSLTELAALIAKSYFFVGGDTGPMHIATSVGTPCVGLFGTTRPEDSGAYGPQHLAVQKWYQAGSCRERRNADNEAMCDIAVHDVLSACDQMVERLAAGKLQAA